MKQYRLDRLFNPTSGNCLNVAVDHGLFGEPSFLTGIEDMGHVVSTLVQAGPDAIQLSPGQAPLLQSVRGASRPALVLRTDIANVYGRAPPSELFSRLVADPVGQAVRLDAACVVVNLLEIPQQPGVRRQCIENITALVPECDSHSMPLMVEPLVMRSGSGGYEVDGDPGRIATLVRQATELGADLIKADPTMDPADFGMVVEAARVPVLVRGGGRVAATEILARTAAMLAQGARGVDYGRNIIQHPDPAAMTAALMSVIHDGADPATAAALLDNADQ